MGEDLAEITLRIDGMHCGSCVRRVSAALASTPGVEVEEVRIGAARLRANQDASQSMPAVMAALEKAGYRAYLES
jgi:copper chaperone CopZ